MKVLLVDCLNYGLRKHFHEIIPVAPRKIAWILHKLGVEFKFLPFSALHVLKKRELKDFDVLMISAMQSDFKVVKRLVKRR